MATTQSAGRKTLTLPPNVRNTRAALKAGEKGAGMAAIKRAAASTPSAKAAHEPKVHTLMKVSKAIERVWMESLVQAKGGYKDALAIEVSVALALFGQKGGDDDKVSLEAKRALMGVYVEAGFDCKTHVGADYKTVNRRINAAAALYAKLGGKATVVDWIDGAVPKEQVNTILEHVRKYNFEGINSILTYVGKATKTVRPRNGTPTGTGGTGAKPQSQADKDVAALLDKGVQDRRDAEGSTNRRATDQLPAGRIIASGAMTVGVPMDAKYEDVIGLANKLTEFANAFLKVASPVAAAPATA